MKFDLKNKSLLDVSPFIFLNYLILLIATVMYTDTTLVPPDIKFRVLFSILLILPLLKYPYLTPAVLTIFVSIRQFSVAPFGYIPSTPEFYFFTVLLIIIWQMKTLKKRKKTNYVFYCLFLFPFISNLLNLNINYEFLMYVLLLILLIDLIKTEEQLILLEKSFVLVTVILAIYTIIFAEQFIIEDALYLDIERSFWNDPNYLGSFMSFGIIISVYHILDLNRNFFKSIFYTVVIIVGFMALGILASRGAIISSIIPIIYLLFKKNNSVKKILINFLIVIIITYIGLSYVSTDALISRFNDDSLSKGNGRLIIWEKSLNIFSSSDYLTLLFGGGTNYSLEICGKAMGINIYSPHNNFLQILYDYGIVGFGFFVFFMGIVYLKIRKNLLGVALFFSFLITCFSLVPFMYMPFWFLLTFIIGCIKIENISKFF